MYILQLHSFWFCQFSPHFNSHPAYYNPLSRTGTGLLKLMCKCNIVSNRRQMALFAFKMRALTKYPTFVLPRIGIYIGIYYWKCHTVKEDRKKWFLCRVCVCSTSHACVKYGTELRITYLYILIQGRIFHYIRHRGLILGPYKVNMCISCHRRGVWSYGKLPSR